MLGSDITILNQFLFGLVPYIALTVMVVGSIIRYDREQYSWKTGSSQMLESKQLRRGSIPFHIGILAIFAGHFVGLLTPNAVWHALGVSASTKQLIAMGAGGFFGLICFYGMVILIKRRLTNPRVRATSTRMDIAILLVLFAQLDFGSWINFCVGWPSGWRRDAQANELGAKYRYLRSHHCRRQYRLSSLDL